MDTLIIPRSKLYEYKRIMSLTSSERDYQVKELFFDFKKDNCKIDKANIGKINAKLILSSNKIADNYYFKPKYWPRMFSNIETLEILIEDESTDLSNQKHLTIDLTCIKNELVVKNLIINCSKCKFVEAMTGSYYFYDITPKQYTDSKFIVLFPSHKNNVKITNLVLSNSDNIRKEVFIAYDENLESISIPKSNCIITDFDESNLLDTSSNSTSLRIKNCPNLKTLNFDSLTVTITKHDLFYNFEAFLPNDKVHSFLAMPFPYYIENCAKCKISAKQLKFAAAPVKVEFGDHRNHYHTEILPVWKKHTMSIMDNIPKSIENWPIKKFNIFIDTNISLFEEWYSDIYKSIRKILGADENNFVKDQVINYPNPVIFTTKKVKK